MKNSEKDVSDRIRQFRMQNDLTIQKFCEEIGFPKGTFEKYINGPKYPNVEFILAFSAKYGISIDWLLEGIEPVFRSQKVVTQNISEISDFTPIQRIELEASAGYGINIDEERGGGTYAFNERWLQSRGLKANSLAVISVHGDSMEPELHNGDLILIDYAATELIDSNIYAVRFSDALYVKRVQHLPGNKVHLISSNRNYPPIEITHPEADGVQIIGRVVASMHEW